MSKVKRPKMIKENDPRVSGNEHKNQKDDKPEAVVETLAPTSMFFSYNQALGPPYHILVDTNMLWQTVADKVDLIDGMQKCLLAKCVPIVTDCVVAELEKLGRKFHLALKLTKDPRVRHLKCGCHGNYADDCIVNQVTKNRVYCVATNDKDLRRRIRKIPGVPILYLHQFKFQVERLPDSDFGPRHF